MNYSAEVDGWSDMALYKEQGGDFSKSQLLRQLPKSQPKTEILDLGSTGPWIESGITYEPRIEGNALSLS